MSRTIKAGQFIRLIEDFMIHLYKVHHELPELQRDQVISLMKFEESIDTFKQLVCGVVHLPEFRQHRQRPDFIQFVHPIHYNWGAVAFKDIKPFQPLKEEKQSYFFM